MKEWEARQAGADSEIEITPQMIGAEIIALRNSGLVDSYLKADKYTVAEIFRAMADQSRETSLPRQGYKK